MGRPLGVALILWPFASGLLLGFHRAGRALRNQLRRSSTMTTPRPARIRPALSEWATEVLRRCYPGELPEDVLDRALRMLATADGKLAPNGRVKRGVGGRLPQGRRP